MCVLALVSAHFSFEVDGGADHGCSPGLLPGVATPGNSRQKIAAGGDGACRQGSVAELTTQC